MFLCTLGGVLTMLMCPVNQVVQLHGTRLARNFLAVLVHDQGWNTADLELASQLLLGLGIHFGQAKLRLQLRSGLLKNRCHHFARSAPGRPKIHQHRNIRMANMLAEAIVIQHQGAAIK